MTMPREDPPDDAEVVPWEEYDDGKWTKAVQGVHYDNRNSFISAGASWAFRHRRRFHRRTHPGLVYFRLTPIPQEQPAADTPAADDFAEAREAVQTAQAAFLEPQANVRLRPVPPDAA